MSYSFDDNPERIDFEALWQYLSTGAAWHRWRTRDQVKRQVVRGSCVRTHRAHHPSAFTGAVLGWLRDFDGARRLGRSWTGDKTPLVRGLVPSSTGLKP